MLQSSAVVLSIVIISLASHCASCLKTENAGRKGPLSIILVPFPAPSHMMGLATLGEKLIEQGQRALISVWQRLKLSMWKLADKLLIGLE